MTFLFPVDKKKIIIDTSSNIILATNLAKLKNWKIIILIRDPRGIVYSLKNSATRHSKNIPKDLWRDYIIDFIEKVNLFSSMNNVILIKYEDLCINPKKIVNKICNFLEINFDEKILKYRQNKGHILMSNRMRFGTNEDITEDTNWKIYLSKKDIKTICKDKKLSTAYKKYNYDI